jgi:hypothetical protein
MGTPTGGSPTGGSSPPGPPPGSPGGANAVSEKKQSIAAKINKVFFMGSSYLMTIF